jgi:hypothetical protein
MAWTNWSTATVFISILANTSTPVPERIHGLEERALAPCTRAKPCWLTEWGAPIQTFPPLSDETRRKLFRTEREAFKTFVNEGPPRSITTGRVSMGSNTHPSSGAASSPKPGKLA